jgi:hypothetical protein
MAKKCKLTRNQNELLGKTKDLREKFSLLEQWLRQGEISTELYNSTVNKLINRSMKDAKPSFDLDDRTGYGLAIEAQIQELIDRLRANLNLFLSKRDKEQAKISLSDMVLFKKYINEYPHLRSKVNRLLIVGLRYPDKELNSVCEEYILQHRLIEKIKHADCSFWLLLWEDGNLVPLNAVRLMTVKTETGGYALSPCFNKFLIAELIPSVQFQRDKEKLRLEWAMGLSDPTKRALEVKRKQKRLNAFECLLNLLKNSL